LKATEEAAFFLWEDQKNFVRWSIALDRLAVMASWGSRFRSWAACFRSDRKQAAHYGCIHQHFTGHGLNEVSCRDVSAIAFGQDNQRLHDNASAAGFAILDSKPEILPRPALLSVQLLSQSMRGLRGFDPDFPKEF
jgi:hypothetical protein